MIQYMFLWVYVAIMCWFGMVSTSEVHSHKWVYGTLYPWFFFICLFSIAMWIFNIIFSLFYE
jgi:hypothetical protein